MARIVAAVVLGVSVLFLVGQGGAAVRDLMRAGTMNVEVTGADLRERCGYDRFDGEWRGKPNERCPELIREILRAAGTRGGVKAMVDGHSRGRVCVGGLLDLSDGELARAYGGWVERQRYAELNAVPAELVINLVLMNKYQCRGGGARHG